MPSLVRTWAAAFVGLLLLQAVWLLVIPPFQGVDEHDHAFKAAAVARGDWSGDHVAVEVGRGELVAIPGDIAGAAHASCEALSYTRRDDCNPTAELADGRVLIGSSAARYNPTFYAVTGTAALPFDGIAAGYAMRIATAVWCAGLLALAIAVVRRTARTPWPAAALVAACTPTMLYSTSIVAPNGPEMAAGLLLWCTLLFGASDDTPAPRWVVIAGTVAAIHLALLRSLGPLWLILIVGTAALAMGIPAFLRAARARRWLLPVVATSVVLVAGVSWTLASGTNSPSAEPGPDFPGSPWPQMFSNWLAWLFQQVSAVPNRRTAGPVYVYVIALAVWAVLLVLSVRASRPRARVATFAMFTVVTALSITVTVLSYTRLGYAWQGRYAWPYVVGWLVLAGWSLDRSAKPTRGARHMAYAAALATAVCVAGTALDVLDHFATTSPYAGDRWSPPHPLLICALIASGVGLLVVSVLPRAVDALRPESIRLPTATGSGAS